MTNKDWVSHVKQFAFKNNIVYMQALKSIECQESYKKKERKYQGIKDLRKEQNQMVINYLNKNDIPKEQFQQEYLKLEFKIKNKMSDSKRYRIKYKKTLKENNA